MKKQAVKWARFRHKATWFLLKPAFFLYARIHYGARIEKYADAGKTPCVYLYNHVTGFDQFFVALSFARPIYFVATEDIFSLGFLSKALSFLVAPIPIKKHSTDIKALKNILTVVKEGNSIAIAPEGNRTYSGRTGQTTNTKERSSVISRRRTKTSTARLTSPCPRTFRAASTNCM